MKSEVSEVPIPEDIKDALVKLSMASGQPVSTIVAEALRRYIDSRMRQILDLNDAIDAADRGEFASDTEVDAFFAKYGA